MPIVTHLSRPDRCRQPSVDLCRWIDLTDDFNRAPGVAVPAFWRAIRPGAAAHSRGC